jgi:penicillin-binding protein 1A
VAHNSLIIKKKEVRFLTEEAILSYKIAKKYSNDEILEFHLNKIYFGHGIFGFPAASDYYFKKDITQLQIHEIAFLISISMDYLHSYILEEEKTLLNPETAKINRDRILSYMARRGVITPAQAEESKVMPLSNVIEKIQTEL